MGGRGFFTLPRRIFFQVMIPRNKVEIFFWGDFVSVSCSNPGDFTLIGFRSSNTSNQAQFPPNPNGATAANARVNKKMSTLANSLLPPLSSTLIKCIQTLTHHTVSCQHESSMPDPRNQTKLSPHLHTSVDATSPHLIVRKKTLFVDDASKSTPPNPCLTLPATKCTSQIHNPCNVIH